MLSICSTRFFIGGNLYGKPPVAVFELSGDFSSAGQPEVEACVRSELSALGVGCTAVAGPEPLSLRLFGTMVHSFMVHAGHGVGAPRLLVKNDDAWILALSCGDLRTTFFAGELAQDLLSGCCEQRRKEWFSNQEWLAFLAYADERFPDPNGLLIGDAAQERDLPILRPPPSLEPRKQGRIGRRQILVGTGIHGHRFFGSMPVGSAKKPGFVALFSDRQRLVRTLSAAGIPLPGGRERGFLVSGTSAAILAAGRLGYPVTIMPATRDLFADEYVPNQRFGPLDTVAQVASVFDWFASEGRSVWMEQLPRADLYRFLVIAGKVVSVIRLRPDMVRGDGYNTVTELIDEYAGSDPEPAARAAWRRLLVNPELPLRLRLAGVESDEILETGRSVIVGSGIPPYQVGVPEDVTCQVSGQLRAVAESAVAVCGLSTLGGVDIICRDLSGEAVFPNCTVVDVMPDPDLSAHSQSRGCDHHDGVSAMMDHLFPAGTRARVPLVVVTGTNGKSSTCRILAGILRRSGLHVGLATTDHAMWDDELLVSGDKAGIFGAAVVLGDQRTEAAVIEAAHGGLHLLGSPLDHWDVGICLNVERDHIGTLGIADLDAMAEVKSAVVRGATGAVILNADDSRVRTMKPSDSRAERILVSTRENSSEVRDHLAGGGRAVVLEGVGTGSCIVFYQGSVREHLLWARDIPATYGGRARFMAANASFSAAAALALGLSPQVIRDGLRSFSSTFGSNPGRFIVREDLPFLVVLDFAHNAHGYAALVEALRDWPVSGRRIAVIRSLGDRSDDDVRANARVLAGHFDYYVCTNYGSLRAGRTREEIPAILASALLEAGVIPSAIGCFPDKLDALDHAVSIAAPGDLVFLNVGRDGGQVWEHVCKAAQQT